MFLAAQLGVLAFLVFAGLGCSGDLNDVTFSLGPKLFHFETTRVVWGSAPDRLISKDCQHPGDCCDALGSVAIDCGAVSFGCEQTCQMRFDLAQAQPVLLFRDVPDLALLNPGSLQRTVPRDVRIAWQDREIEGEISRVDLVLAPFPTPNPDHPDARVIATVQNLSSDAPGARGRVMPGAGAVLQRHLAARSDPVSMILVASFDLQAGAAIPRGEFKLAVELDMVTDVGF